jgi:hypothetical protein
MQTLLEEIDQQITEQFFTDTLGQLFTDTFTPPMDLSLCSRCSAPAFDLKSEVKQAQTHKIMKHIDKAA